MTEDRVFIYQGSPGTPGPSIERGNVVVLGSVDRKIVMTNLEKDTRVLGIATQDLGSPGGRGLVRISGMVGTPEGGINPGGPIVPGDFLVTGSPTGLVFGTPNPPASGEQLGKALSSGGVGTPIEGLIDLG